MRSRWICGGLLLCLLVGCRSRKRVVTRGEERAVQRLEVKDTAAVSQRAELVWVETLEEWEEPVRVTAVDSAVGRKRVRRSVVEVQQRKEEQKEVKQLEEMSSQRSEVLKENRSSRKGGCNWSMRLALVLVSVAALLVCWEWFRGKYSGFLR